MTKPPEGYSCNIVGFNNIPAPASSDRMPTPNSKPTPLADHVKEGSNTTRLPVASPNMPKGI